MKSSCQSRENKATCYKIKLLGSFSFTFLDVFTHKISNAINHYQLTKILNNSATPLKTYWLNFYKRSPAT